MPYQDLREYLEALEHKGLLCHVTAEVDKDWEISAVCRHTFRTIPQERRPALMVSGINHGPNLADDVTYSGTVAAAIEASLLGVPAIAFSLVSRTRLDFRAATKFAQELAKAALENSPPSKMLLNVNIPADVEWPGYAITRLGKHSYGFDVVENVDPRGRKYYWIGGSEYQHEDIPGSDCNATIDNRLISVTPLQLNLTDQQLLSELEQWKIEGFERRGA